MKNITKIICGVVMGTIMAITCVACTNDKNDNVEETTTTAESTEVETETETEIETETETETETDVTEEVSETVEIETVLEIETNTIETTVKVGPEKKSAPRKENTIYTTATVSTEEDRDMGAENEEVEVEKADVTVADSDYILLCNAVAHEAGSNWIATEDKAKVAEVILNRVNSGSYPNSIYGVITQKGQFSGYWNYANLGDYSGKVTEDVKAAVDMALSSDYNNHGYTGFWGDGSQNHFH